MRRTNWLAGLVVGAIGGIFFWVFPIVAVLVLALFALLAAIRRDGLFGVSGLLIGFGGSWLGVLLQSIVRCDRFNGAPDSECVAPDLTAWIVLGAGLLVSGSVLLVLAARRSRQVTHPLTHRP